MDGVRKEIRRGLRCISTAQERSATKPASRVWRRPTAVSAVRGAAADGGDASGAGASLRRAALAGVDGPGSA